MENDVEVDLAQLIHRGGVFKNVEGNTPQEIYAKVCKMIDLLRQFTRLCVTVKQF